MASTLIILIGKGAWTIPLIFLAWGVRFMIHRGGERAAAVYSLIATAKLKDIADQHFRRGEYEA